ncbi:MAG: dihydroneopterin aldolase, partial [Alphaproteobacteria bacterium]|nr:dihydroneopterin aldolase [Alphaproteobacteria bacterium]
MSQAAKPLPTLLPGKTPADALDSVFIRDLELGASIGVHKHERSDSQTVRINVEMSVQRGTKDKVEIEDDLVNVVSYEDVVLGIKSIIARGHINLVET